MTAFSDYRRWHKVDLSYKVTDPRRENIVALFNQCRAYCYAHISEKVKQGWWYNVSMGDNNARVVFYIQDSEAALAFKLANG